MRSIGRTAVVIGVTAVLAGCGADGPDVGEGAAGQTLPPAVSTPSIDAEAGAVGAAAEHDDGHAGDATAVAEHDAEHADTMADEGHDDAMEDEGHDDAMEDEGHDAAMEDDGHDAEGHDAEHDEGDDTGHDGSTPTPGVEDATDAAGIVVGVEMVEFGYHLDRDTVPQGVPITFRFVNAGAIEHEAMFGSAHQQEEFAAAGDHGDHDGHGGHHGDVVALTLGARSSGELVVTFDEPGEMIIGCHLPGHWDAGMAASITVTA